MSYYKKVFMIKFSLGSKCVSDKEQIKDLPWYDKKEVIGNHLCSLETFNVLLRERNNASYKRNEQLHNYYILGRYILDSCGNCMKATGKIPKEIVPDIPNVLTSNEFHEIMKGTYSFSLINDIPTSNLKCPYCGKGWDIKNCYDVVIQKNTEELLNLTNFIGKKFYDVKLLFMNKNIACYLTNEIRNDRFIDLTLKYPNSTKDWENKIVVNEKGWTEITDDYIIQSGDDCVLTLRKYFHKSCNRKQIDIDQENKFKDLFNKAGFEDFSMEKTLNEYCSCDHCTSWFNIITKFGIFKIGWRKRVIKIDWENIIEIQLKRKCIGHKYCPKTVGVSCVNTKEIKTEILSIFAEENTTKNDTFIHAWGYEKAEEYLKKIYSFLNKEIYN